MTDSARKRAHTIISGRLDGVGRASGKPYRIVYVWADDSEERRKEAYLESRNDPDHYGGTYHGESVAFLYIEGLAKEKATN